MELEASDIRVTPSRSDPANGRKASSPAPCFSANWRAILRRAVRLDQASDALRRRSRWAALTGRSRCFVLTADLVSGGKWPAEGASRSENVTCVEGFEIGSEERELRTMFGPPNVDRPVNPSDLCTQSATNLRVL